MIVPDEYRLAAETAEPFNHILRIAHAAAEQEQLRVRRRERQRQFVIEATVRITNHLVFIDHQEFGSFTADKPSLLCFQRRHQHRRIKILGKIAGGNADIPASRAPFR